MTRLGKNDRPQGIELYFSAARKAGHRIPDELRAKVLADADRQSREFSRKRASARDQSAIRLWVLAGRMLLASAFSGLAIGYALAQGLEGYLMSGDPAPAEEVDLYTGLDEMLLVEIDD